MDRPTQGQPLRTVAERSPASVTFDVPQAYHDKVVRPEFQGVYRDAMVFVNGTFAAQRPSGYATFVVDQSPFLRHGDQNTIRVDARSHDDSRWYTGAGIYRDTRLIVSGLTHIPHDGTRESTPRTPRCGARTRRLSTPRVPSSAMTPTSLTVTRRASASVPYSSTPSRAFASTARPSNCAGRAFTTTTASWARPRSPGRKSDASSS